MHETFYTEGNHLFDPTGKKVILRGINKRSVQDESDPKGDTYFAEIRKTGANSVRIVWAITKDLKPGGPQTDLKVLDDLITNARKNQLIPMVELHDATGGWARLQELVDYWVRPDVVSLLQEHQAYLLLNIGNGVGDDKVSQTKFTSGYNDAVKRMREAGIHVPLVIDASDSGKDLEIINKTADKLIQADPDKNLLFSVHLFWSKSSGADAELIQSKFKAVVALGYPLIIGEFSKYGGFAGTDEQGNPRSICSEFGEIDYQAILNVCDELEIGWYAWEWGPGNDAVDPLCEAMDMTSDGLLDHLKPGWATDVVNSIKQASEKQDYFRLEPLPKFFFPIRTRMKTLKSVMTDTQHEKPMSEALNDANGDWSKALIVLKDKKRVPAETLQRLDLAHSLADWSRDHVKVVKALADDTTVKSMRDVALHFNVEKLTALVDSDSLPKDAAGDTTEEKKKNFAINLNRKLFRSEPTAVLHRMVKEAEVPIADVKAAAGVASFLDNQPEFNIHTTSIYTAFKNPKAFENISEEHRPAVVEHMKTLQRVQAISPVPEAVPVLMKANLTSATRVAEMPESTFLKIHGQALGEETARQVYTSAVNAHIRNEQALMTMLEARRGTGIAIIDGRQPKEESRLMANYMYNPGEDSTNTEGNHPTTNVDETHAEVPPDEVPLNLETLFGSIDFCECNDCLSVYSPAAYFVEVLQYLRNNNLDPDPDSSDIKFKKDPKDITGTPLEKLFLRRPDLGCLELTCENTFTVLPYVDLVNEVMESFVVHLDEYKDEKEPKQATLEVFNVEKDETTSELLAQPQHVNYQAYCTLKSAVYPFTLPYHQPIDVIRIWLKYLGASRYELLDTFRTKTEVCASIAQTQTQPQDLQALHAMVLDRAADAEFLGITQEEYIILTQEAFWPKAYFELIHHRGQIRYREKIGVKKIHEYYGYPVEAESEMLNRDENLKKGLTFVKDQFLPRTGIKYVDLVELLKTRFINPRLPQGKAMAILENIRYSYRFLQTKVNTNSHDRKARYAELIDFLNTNQPLVQQDPCHPQNPDYCLKKTDFRNWVYCYFERIGRMIVLESSEGLRFPIEGQLFKIDDLTAPIGILRKDGKIEDHAVAGDIIGEITISGLPVAMDNKEPLVDKFGCNELTIIDANGDIWRIDRNGVWPQMKGGIDLVKSVSWERAPDTCDLSKVRLKHLDDSPLHPREYDRIQRFIRLWRKLGWSIAEVDQALIGLSPHPGHEHESGSTKSDECDFVGFDAFQDDCINAKGADSDDCSKVKRKCPDIPYAPKKISTEFLHQLVAVRKLLDLTGLPLDRLLTFWADLSTAGEKSLYARLFLTHNLLGIDKIFESDKNGNFLTESAKISEHMQVLMAALKMKADDIKAVMELCHLPDSLTLANVSMLYRHSLLAKVLHVKFTDLGEVFELFGDPFQSAQDTLKLLTDWGNMEDAGFNFRQLNYLIRNRDDKLRPLAPAKRTILQITKSLYDTLNAIDRDHPDIASDNKAVATSDLVRAKAGLLFEQSVVEKIIGLLEGTMVYTTNAPANLPIIMPDDLAKKLKYNSSQKDPCKPGSASIQVTGILTEAERAQAKALSNNPKWPEAIDRLEKKTLNFFNDALFGIFTNRDEAIKNLLAGDINLLADPKNPNATDANTAPVKRFYFLQHFLPFLRQRLAHRLIVSTMSGAAGLTNEITDLLLSDILRAGESKQAAITILQQVHQKPEISSNDWSGYLIPPIDDEYTFIGTGDAQPTPLKIEGDSYSFPYQQDDPSNVWSTDPVKLKAGRLYWLEVGGQDIGQLQWKTSTSPKAAIPSSILLPDYSSQGTEDAFVKLFKAALLVNGFSLSAGETGYWQTHPADFDGFDFNSVTLQHWRRLQAYTALRDELPQTEMSMIDLFAWASKPNDANKLSEQIAAVTLWKKENVESLIAPEHFDLNQAEAFRNEINLAKLQKALKVSGAIGTDVDHIDRLFRWANPVSSFMVCHNIAEEIRVYLRARYDQEDWEKVVRPLNDQLRENQKQALISYLLSQKELIKWDVVDADSLFEFFLIDVQMDPCMQTSRIKQAISTVQSFVQRCLLGLEERYGVPSEALDRNRWEWMQKYRIWEANRKIFLYPENWIKSELRDDKSPFYKELESELLQKDINSQTVADALKSYLFKVDEVANLKVVGLFQEQDIDKNGKAVYQNGNPVYIKLHVFARTRNAPYSFYYRYLNIADGDWYPWEKVQVDIPSYEDEEAGRISERGTFLVPVVWNRRLIIFFPQFIKKTLPQGDSSIRMTITATEDGEEGINVPTNKPQEFWEIKLAWSEFRNGKWTQKQISDKAVYSDELTPIGDYQFVPRIKTMDDTIDVIVEVSCVSKSNLLGKFQFVNSQLFRVKDESAKKLKAITKFHYFGENIYSLQAKDEGETIPDFDFPAFRDGTEYVAVYFPMNFFSQEQGSYYMFSHSFANVIIEKIVIYSTDPLRSFDHLFEYYLNDVKEKADDEKSCAFGADLISTDVGDVLQLPYNELKRPYSLYNWEAAFHIPMLLADRLLKSQQFDQALKMCHYVLNPFAKGTDDKRFWQFLPFRETDPDNALQNIFLTLQSNQPDQDINEWREKPFQPHVVARRRPSAYMKWVAMKYIEILIAYGDYYFRQNTLETIPLAIQCYVLASHVYGPRGQKIPKRGKTQPHTYNSLLDRWDAFGNAMVELELLAPYSNQTLSIDVNSGGVGLANVFGFASTLYFCIPDNPQLRALGDTIDDRLFKIRHCQDIEGVCRLLPLFEPAIEPGLLVQAAAQGLSISSVLNDLNSPMPNYRFYYLLQKALELCAELKAMGNAFLSIKEKNDAEALSQLRAQHESSIHNLVMEVKKQQLEEAGKALDALQQSRKGPEHRLQHHLNLLGEDLGKVPSDDEDFSEIQNLYGQLAEESGFKLNENEREEMDKASSAADWQTGIGFVETLASAFHALPTMNAAGHPLGIGIDVLWGFPNLANGTQAVARGLRIYADHLSYQSTNAGRKAGFLRQLQDRVLQANIAGYEIKNIDKQILTQQIRINIAEREITNQQKQIDNAQEVEEFLRNKYTNQELYIWMEGQVRTLYYQAYTLAYDLAKRAEKVYRFERGLATSDFIKFGYWDAGHDGLFSGERLYIGLKQLEAAYQEKRGHDFEITKSISLLQLNPLALIQLKETGSCEFALPEVLFDMDYPGHYLRRIKSVGLRIPCTVGPYTSLNCTLRLLEHKFRTNAIANDKSDYPEKTDGPEDRFSTVNMPITAIAVSSLEDENGVFELNFHDERYLPFEGAGAVSRWRLELPDKFRQFDYDTISDVILRLRYTSVDGGDKLKKPASDSVMEYIKSVEDLSREEGLFAFFDLKNEFPSEWYCANQPAAGATERVLTIEKLYEKLPIFTKGRAPAKIQAMDIYLFASGSISASSIIATQGGNEIAFTDGQTIGSMKSFVAKDVGVAMDILQIKIGDTKTAIDKMWLLERYVLT